MIDFFQRKCNNNVQKEDRFEVNIGEQICNLRKDNNLSQDDFANIFQVSRQTVSNWENGKSYPDLETIIKISDYFKLSVDELLKKNTDVVTQIDGEKKKNHRYFLMLIGVFIVAGVIILGMYFKYQNAKEIEFSMNKSETYVIGKKESMSMNVANGYFNLPENGKVEVKVQAVTDDGKLHIKIMDDKNKICYQLDGQDLTDTQSIYLQKGSYIIQIDADDYNEDIVSLEYNIAINN